MSILDEMKKLSFNHTSAESINSKGIAKVYYEPVVKLSDIEKILGEMKCEKCNANFECTKKILHFTDTEKPIDFYSLFKAIE